MAAEAAEEVIGDVAVTAALVVAVREDRTRWATVDHGVVIVDVAVDGVGADLASAQAPGPQGRLVGIAQRALSRLWTCRSVLKSPESQAK